MNRVEISLEGVKAPWKKNVAPFMDKVLAKLGGENKELSLLFCDNACIQELNRRYRNLDEPTDILSFGQDEAPGPVSPCLGDIVISLETLEENAAYFKVSPDEELRRLLIHGILHLKGMDHAGNDPSEPMLVKQEAILKELSTEQIVRYT